MKLGYRQKKNVEKMGSKENETLTVTVAGYRTMCGFHFLCCLVNFTFTYIFTMRLYDFFLS